MSLSPALSCARENFNYRVPPSLLVQLLLPLVSFRTKNLVSLFRFFVKAAVGRGAKDDNRELLSRVLLVIQIFEASRGTGKQATDFHLREVVEKCPERDVSAR
jgi:hypothetical protein